MHGDLLSLSVKRVKYVSSLLVERWEDDFKDKYPLVVPFAHCGNGALHCIDYSHESMPRVVLWMLDMAYGDESPFKLIAPTFEDYAAHSTLSNE